MIRFKERKEARMWRLRKTMLKENEDKIDDNRLEKLKEIYFDSHYK